MENAEQCGTIIRLEFAYGGRRKGMVPIATFRLYYISAPFNHLLNWLMS